ncbi:hypothetical protein N658DRAFT_482155 [Parathielavia hyrcaniae]|uniref:RRM domain-containing protein n=1 Tax=Parathielavia hyrcaniae TaxID=113614 RepID=A0AAN6T661_9PEZI|nr:hypothetical protein N658DRAFT_482155 [Parathielavia hyrcaniae]
MHRHHQHNRHLETYTVEPGTETGLYYILVANLAHRTTWRDLKAFASQACEVDHAEVYPPTSGFVRVKGQVNFEKAIRYLDGNTLEYRALQADGRNMNQPTVVKLPPGDYHAERIRRGGSVRVVDEPDSPVLDPNALPKPFHQGAGAGMGSPYSDYQGSASSAFNAASQAAMQWRYVMASSYVPGEDYQSAMPSAALMSPNPMAYQAMAPPNHGFIQPVATGPLPASTPSVMYQTASSPLSVMAHPASTRYDAPASYFQQGATYALEGQGYAGYYQRPAEEAGYYSPWLPDAATSAPPQPEQITTTTSSLSHIPKEHPPPATTTTTTTDQQQRKIVIHNLDRENLSEAVVMSHIAQLKSTTTTTTTTTAAAAAAAATAGQVERIELSANSSGRPRAFVTFSAAGPAAAAVAALDGRVVGGRKLAARVLEEGGAGLAGGSGGGGGGGGGRHGRRGQGRGSSSSSSSALGAGAAMVNLRGDAGRLSSKASHSEGGRSSVGGFGSAGPSGSGGGSLDAAGREDICIQESGKKEQRPVVVDGSGGRWKKRAAPVVVDGSAAGRKGNGGERGSR